MSASKFTPEVRGAGIERIAAGVSLADACHAAGVRDMTVKGWLTRGRRDDAGLYFDFAQAVAAARDAARDRPAPMDEAELARVVSEAARRGSVQAMKLRHEMLRAIEEPEDAEDDPLAEVDELARERRGRA